MATDIKVSVLFTVYSTLISLVLRLCVSKDKDKKCGKAMIVLFLMQRRARSKEVNASLLFQSTQP
jgi:hypothetical protein